MSVSVFSACVTSLPAACWSMSGGSLLGITTAFLLNLDSRALTHFLLLRWCSTADSLEVSLAPQMPQVKPTPPCSDSTRDMAPTLFSGLVVVAMATICGSGLASFMVRNSFCPLSFLALREDASAAGSSSPFLMASVRSRASAHRLAHAALARSCRKRRRCSASSSVSSLGAAGVASSASSPVFCRYFPRFTPEARVYVGFIGSHVAVNSGASISAGVGHRVMTYCRSAATRVSMASVADISVSPSPGSRSRLFFDRFSMPGLYGGTAWGPVRPPPGAACSGAGTGYGTRADARAATGLCGACSAGGTCCCRYAASAAATASASPLCSGPLRSNIRQGSAPATVTSTFTGPSPVTRSQIRPDLGARCALIDSPTPFTPSGRSAGSDSSSLDTLYQNSLTRLGSSCSNGIVRCVCGSRMASSGYRGDAFRRSLNCTHTRPAMLPAEWLPRPRERGAGQARTPPRACRLPQPSPPRPPGSAQGRTKPRAR
mmetsp:Transcript_40303/g.104318  ORF Transcript_40303/g.104318 Transcript_40303/m.104318 type:complete len:488 (-) Transcript_40303:102-1565(-)